MQRCQKVKKILPKTQNKTIKMSCIEASNEKIRKQTIVKIDKIKTDIFENFKN